MATIVAATGAAGNWTAGSAWVGGVAPTAADDAQITVLTTSITIDAGAVCRSADFNGCTGVVTHNTATTFNIGDGTAGLSNIALRLSAGMTYTLVNANSSALNFKSTSATQQSITTNGKTIGAFSIGGAGSSYILADDLICGGIAFTYSSGATFDMTTNTTTVTLNSAGDVAITPTQPIIFYNLTRTGTAVKTDKLILGGGNITVSNTFTCTGNSPANRVIVQSNTKGTARTITAAAVTVDKTDFQDITGAGAASWDMSAAAGYTGNCGGNTMQALGTAAFTTAATCNWSSGTTWSTATWSNHSIPLPQDTATFTTAGTVTITQDMPRIGAVDFSTSANKTWTLSVNNAGVYGSINLTNLSVFNDNATTSFLGRGTHTITSAGLFFDSNNVTFDSVGGSYTMQDAATLSGIIHNSGGLIFNNISVTSGSYNSNNSTVRALTLGTGTFTITSSPFTLGAGTNMTLTSTGSTVKFTTTSAITFTGGSKTWNNVWFAHGVGTGSITMAGSNNFTDFKDDGTGNHSILFTAATTQHVTTFTVSGSATNTITINSTTTGTHALVKDGGGTISCDYLNIQHSVATPATTWYAGANSTNNQATATAGSGWIFAAPTAISSIAGVSYANVSSVNSVAKANIASISSVV